MQLITMHSSLLCSSSPPCFDMNLSSQQGQHDMHHDLFLRQLPNRPMLLERAMQATQRNVKVRGTGQTTQHLGWGTSQHTQQQRCSRCSTQLLPLLWVVCQQFHVVRPNTSSMRCQQNEATA